MVHYTHCGIELKFWPSQQYFLSYMYPVTGFLCSPYMLAVMFHLPVVQVLLWKTVSVLMYVPWYHMHGMMVCPLSRAIFLSVSTRRLCQLGWTMCNFEKIHIKPRLSFAAQICFTMVTQQLQSLHADAQVPGRMHGIDVLLVRRAFSSKWCRACTLLKMGPPGLKRMSHQPRLWLTDARAE